MHRIAALVAGVSFFVHIACAGPIPDGAWLNSIDKPDIPAEYGEALLYADVPVRGGGVVTPEHFTAASTLLYDSLFGSHTVGGSGQPPGKDNSHKVVPSGELLATQEEATAAQAIESAAVTGVTTAQTENDAQQDVETTVISINKNNNMYTTAVRIKYGLNDATSFKLYYTTTISPPSGVFGSFVSGYIPMPAGWSNAADPYLSMNPYTSGVGAGQMVLTGLLMNSDDNRAIAVWRSQDGGLTWSQPTIVKMGSLVDKPHIAVSWHSGTRGYIYVAYTQFDPSASPNARIYVARSTNGGASFTTPVLVTASDNINGA